MFCVGFLEELIFRGLLFEAMREESERAATIVSAVTFGIGHIVNLLNGADILQTLLQIIYAVAAGLMFTAIFYKTKSLIPCIVTPSLLNMSSILCVEADEKTQIISALETAKSRGLTIPILYNTSGYEKIETLKELNLENNVYAVENCGLENEKIYNSLDEFDEKMGYFTIVVVK